MSPAGSRGAALGLLLACAAAAFSAHVKFRHSTGLPHYRPGEDAGYFNVESAFQYRYARMIAAGIAVPEVDRDAQYPEGVRTSSELTMPMKYLTGWTHAFLRGAPGPDFLGFVLLWVAAVSSLSVPAFFGAALRLTKDPALAGAGTLAYGLSWASISDLIGTYGFQTLALPLLLGSVFLFLAALEPEIENPRAWGTGAGLLLAGALSSWHVSRFFLAGWLAAIAWTAWRRREDRAAIVSLRRALAFLLGGAAIAGLLVPVLRDTRLLISPAMLLGWILLSALYLKPKPLIASVAAIIMGAWYSGRGGAEAAGYGHVYALLAGKLKFLLEKPDNPALLSPEARLLWVGPFNSPEAGFLIFTFFPLGLLALPRLLFPRPADAPDEGAGADLVDAMTVLFLLGTTMISRLAPILAFFGLLSALRLPFLPGSGRRKLAIGLIAALGLLEGLKSHAPASRWNPAMRLSAPFSKDDLRPTVSRASERGVIEWLKTRQPGKPVLAHFGFSGAILAYAGNPVVLNPKLESGPLRRKCIGYLEALYKDEQSLLNFCKTQDAALLVHGTGNVLDETQDGTRYAAGVKAFRPEQPAVLMQFHPERLKHFRLLYQNPDFRVFAAGYAPDPKGDFPKDPVYDENQYSPKTQKDGTLGLDAAGVLARRRESRRHLLMARLFISLGAREEALKAYEKAFHAWPPEARLLEEARALDRAGLPAPR